MNAFKQLWMIYKQKIDPHIAITGDNRVPQSQYVFSPRDDLLQFRPCSVLKATHQEVLILFYPKELEEATSAIDFVEGLLLLPEVQVWKTHSIPGSIISTSCKTPGTLL